jgi:hypothetical protein
MNADDRPLGPVRANDWEPGRSHRPARTVSGAGREVIRKSTSSGSERRDSADIGSDCHSGLDVSLTKNVEVEDRRIALRLED